MLEELRHHQQSLAAADRKQSVFNLVKGQVCDKDGMVAIGGHIKWELLGKRVCRSFWQYAHATSQKQVEKNLEATKGNQKNDMNNVEI